MKKHYYFNRSILAVLLVLSLLLPSLGGCGRSDDVPDDTTEETEQDKQPEGKVIYEADGVKITEKGIGYDNIAIYFQIQNSSDKDILVSTNNVAINKIIFDFFGEVYCGKGKSAELCVYTDKDMLNATQVYTVEAVGIQFKLYDTEAKQDILTTDMLSYETGKSDTTKDAPGEVLFEEHGVRATYLGWTSAENGYDLHFKFDCSSNTANHVFLSNLSINGKDFDVETHPYQLLSNGYSSYANTRISETQIINHEIYNIASIDTVEFCFGIYDSEKGFNIYPNKKEIVFSQFPIVPYNAVTTIDEIKRLTIDDSPVASPIQWFDNYVETYNLTRDLIIAFLSNDTDTFTEITLGYRLDKSEYEGLFDPYATLRFGSYYVWIETYDDLFPIAYLIVDITESGLDTIPTGIHKYVIDYSPFGISIEDVTQTINLETANPKHGEYIQGFLNWETYKILDPTSDAEPLRGDAPGGGGLFWYYEFIDSDETSVTIQYYADYYYTIKSHVIKYYFDENDPTKIVSSDVISTGKYEPISWGV